MQYGIQLTAGMSTYMTSDFRVPVLVGYAKVQYDEPATKTAYAATATVLVTMQKAVPMKMFKSLGIQDDGNEVFEPIDPNTMFYGCTSTGDAWLCYASNVPLGITHPESGIALNGTIDTVEGGASFYCFLGAKDKTVTRLQGTLYIAIFMNLPPTPLQDTWGVSLYNSAGSCNFSSVYEPFIVDRVSVLPGIDKTSIDQNEGKISIPSDDLYLTPSMGKTAYHENWHIGLGTSDFAYTICSDPEGYLVHRVYWQDHAAPIFGTSVTAVYAEAGSSPILLLRKSDYFD